MRKLIRVIACLILAGLMGLAMAPAMAVPSDVDTETLAPQIPCPFASLIGCWRPKWDYETLGGGDSGGDSGAGDSGGDAGEGDGGEGEGGGCSY